MATFKQYTKKDGSKAWMFNVRLGTDYVTRKEIKTTRRGFKTKKEAQLALNQLVFEFEQKDVATEKEDLTTIEDMYHIWFATYKDTVKETTYLQTDNRMKKYVIPVFGKMIISRITPKVAQKAINEWAEHFDLYKELLRYLVKVCDHAVMLEVVDSNPFRKVIKPKNIVRKKKQKIKFYTSQELELFLETIEKQRYEPKESQPSLLYYCEYDVALFRLLAFSGVRIGEALSLYWTDVDFDEQTIDVSKSLSSVKGGYAISTTKTFSSVRTISLDTKTIEILKKWKLYQAKSFMSSGRRNKHNLLFCRDNGEIQGHPAINGRSKRIAERAGLNCIGCHGFRHTHATLLFESGVEAKEVQHRLGHSDVSMTLNVYTHITKKVEKKAISTMVQHLGF